MVLAREGKAWLRATADDGLFITEGDDPAFVLDILDTFIRGHIALHAPGHVFVHAGAVALDGVALVFPGGPLIGKSTLAAALVRAGATYLSDEFAVLDPGGTVLPYPRRITPRGVDPVAPTTTNGPNLVALVLFTEFRPNANWSPTRLTAGAGALRMFEHAVTAPERPVDALTAVTNAVAEAELLDGPRGEADDVAPALVAELGALGRSRAAQRSSNASS